MTQKLWLFEAIDTLFFRDGTPFTADEAVSRTVQSVFPPYMTTLQGAIRAALAKGQGWSPNIRNSWPEELGGPLSLGQLELKGPYLLYENQFIYPMPAVILGAKDKNTRLVPGSEPAETDLGEVYLPVVCGLDNGVKELEGHWLTSEGMDCVLRGGIPGIESVVAPEAIWRREGRIGIERNPQTRSTVRGKFYSIAHVRPSKEVKLGVLVAGVPEGWDKNVPKHIPLGGEGRVAAIEICEPGKILPEIPELPCEAGRLKFTVFLITPAKASDVQNLIVQGPLPGLKCKSACVPKLKQLGGWDIKNGCPRPLAPVIPAGATWFYEVEEKHLDTVRQFHGSCVGTDSNFGFGQIIIGRWEE